MIKKLLARQNTLGRLIFRTTYIELEDSLIRIHPSQISIKVGELSGFITATKLPWGDRIVFTKGQKSHKIGFLVKSESKIIIEEINAIFARNLEIRILGILNYFKQAAVNAYLRDSKIPNLQLELNFLHSEFRKFSSLWSRYLPKKLIRELTALEAFHPIESHAQKLRATYEIKMQSEHAKFFSTVEENPLSQEQCLAVVRDNDYNLILAGAGTGKTSVIIAKALFLQEAGQSKASDILILAYNKAAASELIERYEKCAKAAGGDTDKFPTIKTFHALGRDILKQTNSDISISELQEDSTKFVIWVTKWLGAYICDSDTGLPDFITILYEPVNPFSFGTKEEYERHVRDNEYRTLQGELVKSYQEVLIANWLFEHAIEYTYEPKYPVRVLVEAGIVYKPDFYLSEFDIYIEHFGVDRNGRTRPGIDAEEYANQMDWKRKLHREQKTHLVETYHYDWCEDNLFSSLTDKLQKKISEERISSFDQEIWVPVRRPQKEILRTLNEMGHVSDKAKLLLDCLTAIRVENIQENDILNRLQNRNIGFPEIWSKILNQLVSDYLFELKSTETIDFDDMIIRASKIINSGNYNAKWTHILVDEFQDISNSRMNLVRAIVSGDQTPSLAVVGDDWQAIYRFSGGKLKLTTQFEELVGKNTTSKLQTTYRYNDSIAHVAGTFVMQNPEQYKKTINSQIEVDSPKVFLLDDIIGEEVSLVKKVSMTIAKLRRSAPGESFAVLARYNYLLQQCRDENKRKGV